MGTGKAGARSETKGKDKREGGPRKNKAKAKPDKKRKAEPHNQKAFGVKKRASKYNKFPGGGKKSSRFDKSAQTRRLADALKQAELDATRQAENVARAEILLTESQGYLEAEGFEQTYRFKQSDIVKAVDQNAAAKVFDLALPEFSPYTVDVSSNGRHVAFGGRKGHLSVMDRLTHKMEFEVHVQERIRDVKFLHNNRYVACAQRNHVFIYDHQGTELHSLKKLTRTTHLDFLPHHFLLVSGASSGYLRYTDTSMGKTVVDRNTRMGAVSCLRQNPWNAVVCTGHGNGQVAMWTPNMQAPVVQMFTHKGGVTSLAVDPHGDRLATAGNDGTIKVWDLRNYKAVETIKVRGNVSSMDISQTRMLAFSHGVHVDLWQDIGFPEKRPAGVHNYMTHIYPKNPLTKVRFAPLDDVLVCGNANGIGTMLVPGAGIANIDSFAANPYESSKQRGEKEIRSLLEKLQPNTITLNPDMIGNVDVGDSAMRKEEALAIMAEDNGETYVKDTKIKVELRNKARGGNKAGAVQRRKKLVYASKREEQVEQKRENLLKALNDRAQKRRERKAALPETALKRFMK